MPRRRLRLALAAALAAPLLVGPVGAEAASGPLTCRGVTQTGLWQRLNVTFRGVEGVQTVDAATAYAVDAARPQRLLVTNGTRILRTDSHGCAFRDVLTLGTQGDRGVPLSGTTSTIVGTAWLPGGRTLAAVREGTSAASRPHVISSADGVDGSWTETSTGLPAQGSPRLLEAAGDGRTAYLTLSPAVDAAGDGALPGLPDVGGASAGPAGFLYASTDSGRTWAQRSTLAQLPSGATGFDALAVDAADPNLLYAISDGRLVLSRDGGRTLEIQDVSGATAVEPMDSGEVAVLAGSQLLHSADAGGSFTERTGVPGAGSAAYRRGDGELVVEAEGTLFRVQARTGGGGPVQLEAGVPVTRGSARGDQAEGGSFHALGRNALLRYVDPVGSRVADPPRVPGDLRVPPPPPGRMDPLSRSVTMPVGESRVVDFTLVLPRSPTPLDLYLLIDVSLGMNNFLVDVKKGLLGVADEVKAQGIDLKIGIGTVAGGPREGEPPYPDVDPQDPNYRKPDVYKRVREIGEVDEDLRRALAGVEIQRPPTGRNNDTPEGQLIGLEQLIDGQGEPDGRLGGEARSAYVVPPGQQAGFREAPGIRKIVTLATNEEFTDPYPTRMKDGKPDIDYYGARLRTAGIKQVGLTVQETGTSKPDLQRMARLTGAFAPRGGVDCGENVFLDAGAPLVCDSTENFSQVIGRVLRGLADRQSVSLVRQGPRSLLGDLEASGLRDLDVTVPNAVPFRVRVSCVDVAAGRYTPSVDAVLRETVVATAKLAVTCTAPPVAAAVPPRPQAAQLQEPAAPPVAQPAAQAPAPPVPAPPVVQPQAQPQAQPQTQVQSQVNPAAALQQQEEMQLALALMADEKSAPTGELAMVDRRRGEELRALALLSVAMAAVSVLGLARLRTRRAPAVRVRRS